MNIFAMLAGAWLIGVVSAFVILLILPGPPSRSSLLHPPNRHLRSPIDKR